ncbi:unnamed protein product [Rhizophagus irregularis]|nr:unnamed protein product [Rhizophagus irregularis]
MPPKKSNQKILPNAQNTSKERGSNSKRTSNVEDEKTVKKRGSKKLRPNAAENSTVKITVPEDLDYSVSEESDVGLEKDKLIPLNPDNIINLEEESEIKKNNINLESYSEFQIANFVADHPSILKLANVLRDSKETPAGNSVNESLNIQNEKKTMDKNKKLLIQELKLLFLRCRIANSHIFNSIISATHPHLRTELYRDEAKELRRECGLKMSDFRFKFIATLTEMARTFIDSGEKVEDFIGDSWRNILGLHLKAINKTKFEAMKEDHKRLHNFVLESFKAVVDYEQKKSTISPKDVIKNTLNHITINIKVPLSSGHDIVNNLNIEDLIK